MKLAISNLAWEYEEDDSVKDILLELAVPGVEIALTKIWKNPLEASLSDVKTYRQYWNSQGIEIVALQSLLFGRPDLEIFSDKQKREETLRYLFKIIEVGSELGANAFVFGSPKNRLKREMNNEDAMELAADFFGLLGEKAHKTSTIFCIEPNPKVYGCDFITSTSEGINLVKKVNNPGFQLHLDTAGMALSEENIEESLEMAYPYLYHFHVSEPNLGMVHAGIVDHVTLAKKLKDINYHCNISIEMKQGINPSNLKTVRKSLGFVKDLYF